MAKSVKRSSTTKECKAPSGFAKNILVVDDSASVRAATSQILELLGYTVVGQASNGHEAIQATRVLKPDLILMDVEMPQMNGIAAARQIQKLCPTPVILLTVHDTPDLIHQAREAGVVAYLTKPPDGQELQRTIPIASARFQDWMELRRLNEELAQRNAQLQKAISTIKTLSGLVPICAWCGRKIRDEHGKWIKLESFIEQRSNAQFTHGICPECLNRFSEEEG